MGSRSHHTIILFDPAKKLGCQDEHSPEQALHWLAAVGKKPKSTLPSTLGDSFYFGIDEHTWIGCYPNGLIIANEDMANSMIFADKWSGQSFGHVAHRTNHGSVDP